MIRLGYFPGCSLSGTAHEYEMSIGSISNALGFELVEIKDWNCCGASSAHAINHKLALALCARNLALAEEQGLEILLSPCAMCYNRMVTTHKTLTADGPVKEEIEKVVECLQKLGKNSEIMGEIAKYIEEVGNFALGGLHDSLTSKDSMMAVVYCLIKYEENPEMAKEIAETIGEASFYGYDASGVIKMAKLFSSDEAVKCLSKFTENLEELGNLVRKLNILLNYSRDGREVAMRAIDVISKKAKTAEEAFDIVEREFPNNV